MTNHNPAVPQPNSSNLDRDILAKVNAHADRSIDRLFADIDDLLSGDLDNDPHSSAYSQPAPHATSARTESPAGAYQQYQPASYPPKSQSVPPHPTPVESEQPAPTAVPQPKTGLPLWLKVLLGLSATSLALGGGLLWLINERKIELPKNIDTSWIPFQSSVSPEDAKFADYMRKSIAKIESANTPTAAATNNIATPIATQPAPLTLNPTPAAAVPVKLTSVPVKNSIALVKTLPKSDRPGAVFQIENHSQTVNVGQKIGTTDWTLLTVDKGEVILKRKGGEIRSIYVGQKF